MSSARFHTLRYAVSMHPPLTLENHPLCRDVVIALKRCHRDASWWGRSFGACNEQKWALDQCLKKQKLFKARANAEKAREERDRLRRRVEKYGHATVNGEFKESEGHAAEEEARGGRRGNGGSRPGDEYEVEVRTIRRPRRESRARTNAER